MSNDDVNRLFVFRKQIYHIPLFFVRNEDKSEYYEKAGEEIFCSLLPQMPLFSVKSSIAIKRGQFCRFSKAPWKHARH